MAKFKFIDLFAGIGGFRVALESFGGECVFSSDWDKHAQTVYNANFGEIPQGDITKILEGKPPNHDVLCAGFPCQAFSISGKRLGFEDTRGTLFYDIARIVKHKQPKVLFLENVKHLASHNKGKTLKTILNVLGEINYDTYHKILNASYFGVPTARERIYFVCFRKDLNASFEFPKETYENIHLIDFLDPKAKASRKLEGKFKPKFKEDIDLKRLSENKDLKPIRIGIVNSGGQGERIYSPYGHAITFSAYGGGVFAKTGGYYINGEVRKLTPKEALKVVGLPESFKMPVTDSQAYKLIGNSVAIPVIKEIFYNILETGVLNGKGSKGSQKRA